jgi:hypothetical protein
MNMRRGGDHCGEWVCMCVCDCSIKYIHATSENEIHTLMVSVIAFMEPILFGRSRFIRRFVVLQKKRFAVCISFLSLCLI